MSEQVIGAPFVESVFHPSDFSEHSEAAFAHALAIALVRQTDFTILHAGASYLAEDEWTRFPAVRTTLERWGLLEPGSQRSAVFESLRVRIRKVNLRKRDPLAACLSYLDEHPTDLIVIATEGREGLPRWLRPSMAERLARRSSMLTLFVPHGVRGFVALEDGHVSLRRILVPVDHSPSPELAITYASRVAVMADPGLEVELLHVGEGGFPARVPIANGEISWKKLQRSGDAVDGIIAAAEEGGADLIVMATSGREGFLDVVRGSVTEQVLRRAPCPLLAVPAA